MNLLLSLMGLVFSITEIPKELSQNNESFLQTLNVTVNDSLFNLDSLFLNQLYQKLDKQKFNFTICAISFASDAAYTKVRIPQTFNRRQVIEQCIIYYAFLSDEETRKKEKLEIYPYFKPIEQKPDIVSRYNGNGRLEIMINTWDIVPFPEKPNKFEAEIYNQVMDLIFDQGKLIGSTNRDIFEKIGKLNDMDTDVVTDIYMRVLLWQKSQ